ncbi:MAG TPA: CHAT domain-containing protein, partial [Caldilineaceae bacterium]|nr:CHAT domain-containing protein [Caldilineaceae bacterium]
MKTIVLRIDPIDNAQNGYPARLLDLASEPATVLAQSLLPATLQPQTPPPDQTPWLASDQIIPTFANAAASTPVLRTIGNQLYQVVASGDLQQHIETLPSDTRLILDIRDRMLAALPWELLTQNRKRLFTDATRPICRGLQEKLAPLPLHEWPLRMLLVIGSDDPDVQAAEESQRIREALIDVDADVDLLILARPPKSTLVEQLRQFRPHIFHFAGHGGQVPGGGDSYLRLDSDSGNVQWTGETILHDLQGVDSLRFVFLNACRTTAESQVNYWTLTDAFLEAGVPAVLGMHSDVTGVDAAAFAGQIYRGLAAGKALDVAVAEARLYLINLGADALTRRGWAAPALQVRCAPDSAITVGAGIEEAHRQQVRPAFAEVHRLVDRRKERYQAWASLRQRQIKLIVLKGEQEAGKTSFAKMLMHRCALNKHQVRYIDLQHSRRD